MHSKGSFSRSRRLAIPSTLLASLVFLPWGTAPAVLADVPKDDHGAARMEYQIKQLDGLLSPVDVSKAPPTFDPVVWEAFIPNDNVLTRD